MHAVYRPVCESIELAVPTATARRVSELCPRGAHAAPSSVFSDTPFHAEPAPLGEMAGLGLGQRKLTVRAGDRPRAEGPGQRGREHSLEAPPVPGAGPPPCLQTLGARGRGSRPSESLGRIRRRTQK